MYVLAMNVEDTILLLYRLCENDTEEIDNLSVEEVNPVTEFDPIYPYLKIQI